MEISRREFCTVISSTIIGSTGCLSQNDLANVKSIIDGDTIDVILSDGTLERIRLLGVDTPETGKKSPDEWENIPKNINGERWLDKWAEKATKFTDSTLDNKVEIQTDSISVQRGSYDRLLAYIYPIDSNTSLNNLLLANGFARFYDTKFEKRDKFRQLESKSINNSVGVWGFSSKEKQDIEIVEINEDAEGNDHNNLNDEYIRIKNNKSDPIDMSNWTLSDESHIRYKFPESYRLDSNQTLTIYSGSGQNTKSKIYLNSNQAIWNNNGDIIIINNSNNNTIIKYEY